MHRNAHREPGRGCIAAGPASVGRTAAVTDSYGITGKSTPVHTFLGERSIVPGFARKYFVSCHIPVGLTVARGCCVLRMGDECQDRLELPSGS